MHSRWTCAQPARISRHNSAHHSERGIYRTHDKAVCCGFKSGIVKPESLSAEFYLVEVAEEGIYPSRGLELLLPHNLGQLLLQSLIGNLYDGILLAIVTGWGIADGLTYKFQILFSDRLALVAADTPALKKSFFYCLFHILM